MDRASFSRWLAGADLDWPSCETCPYWDELDRDDDEGEDERREGSCRRHPGATANAGAMEGELGPYAAVWSTTLETDWCGEHPAFLAYRQDLLRAMRAQHREMATQPMSSEGGSGTGEKP